MYINGFIYQNKKNVFYFSFYRDNFTQQISLNHIFETFGWMPLSTDT